MFDSSCLHAKPETPQHYEFQCQLLNTHHPFFEALTIYQTLTYDKSVLSFVHKVVSLINDSFLELM